ncbi:MAG: preprotein translocase subunit SecE [Dermatophilaceae bacterium]
MSETSAPRRTSRPREEGGNVLGRAVRRLSLFVRQILDELSKVVRPTGSELVNYTVVVILFVLAIMAIVAGLDFLLHRLVLFVFAGS